MKYKIIGFQFFVAFIMILCVSYLSAQEQKNDTTVKWLQFDEAFRLQKEKPRYIFMYVYDSTGKDKDLCRKMNDSTFTDKSIVDFLNKRFYPVKVDARMRDSISYFGEEYGPSSNNEIHPLVTDILAGNMQFPSIAFYDKDFRKSVIPGYQDKTNLLPVLVYILEEAFASTTLEDWKKYFFKTYPPNNTSGYSMVRSIVKWKTLEEAFEQSKYKKKKMLLVFEVNWSTSCVMMTMATFNDPVVARIINDNFYPVRIDATTRDTLFFGQEYVNAMPEPGYHQLPIAMLGGKMKFPSILVLNEDFKLINTVQSYMTPVALETMLMYFAGDHYKKTQWPDFAKSFESQVLKNEKEE